MKTLKNVKWKDFPIQEIFNIKATRSSIDKKNLSYIAGNVPYVTRTDRNNGIDLFVGNQPEYQTDEKSVITIGLDTQTVFFQPHKFYTGQNIQVLSNRNLNLYVASFMIPLIKNQLKKFNWGGNGATLGRLKKLRIMLPVTPDGSPNFKFMEQYMRRIEKKLLKRYSRYLDKKGYDMLGNKCLERGKFDVAERWEPMSINKIFPVIQRGKRLKNEDHIPGNMPYVSSSAVDNGVDDFVSNEEKVRVFNDCITIANSGSVGASFYHPYTFVASDHVTQLQRQNGNKYTYLFLATISSRLSEKYSFNREINEPRIKRERLLVPLTPDGSPDYKFMEQYMREKEQKIIHRYIEYRLKNV